jgi:hypothetical protein
LWRRSFPR